MVQGNGLQNRTAAGSNPAVSSILLKRFWPKKPKTLFLFTNINSLHSAIHKGFERLPPHLTFLEISRNFLRWLLFGYTLATSLWPVATKILLLVILGHPLAYQLKLLDTLAWPLD